MIDIAPFQGELFLIFKVLLLIAEFVFILFTFIIISRVRALNRTIYLAASHASASLQILTVIVFFVAVSLFVITLVIV